MKNGDLQVWWCPQVPMKSFECSVGSIREGALLLDALARYDLFQFENRIKPDYCNAGGLQVYCDGDWEDWYDDDGNDIDDRMAELLGKDED